MQDEQITVRLPKALALKARQFADAEGYGSLSDLVRDVLRERIRQSIEASVRESLTSDAGAEMSLDEVNSIVHETRKERNRSKSGPQKVYARYFDLG